MRLLRAELTWINGKDQRMPSRMGRNTNHGASGRDHPGNVRFWRDAGGVSRRQFSHDRTNQSVRCLQTESSGQSRIKPHPLMRSDDTGTAVTRGGAKCPSDFR